MARIESNKTIDEMAKDADGSTPLHYAVENLDSGLVKSLIAAGADVNAKDDELITPLHYAAKNLDFALVKSLIAAGADVNAKDDELITPMHFATKHRRNMKNSVKIVRYLIEKGADPLAQDTSGATPLHWALYIDLLDVVRELAGNKNLINLKNDIGSTPLHCAMSKEAVQILLANGADIKAVDESGGTPLHEVMTEAVVRELIISGADVNAVDNSGKTPLHLADTVSVAKTLIEFGADINIKDKNGQTPEQTAAENDYDEVADFIGEIIEIREASFNGKNKDLYLNKLKHAKKIISDCIRDETVASPDLLKIKDDVLTLHLAYPPATDGLKCNRKPLVPINKSVTADHIICLEDGREFKTLKRHLQTQYNLTPEQYKLKWGLPHNYPMVAPNYSKRRSEIAKSNGFHSANANNKVLAAK